MAKEFKSEKVRIEKRKSEDASGRGTSGLGDAENPSGRFERLHLSTDDYVQLEPNEERPLPRTQFFKDSSRTVLTTNDSPDVGFEASVNPYRGCEHGCIYCFARPTHEYLGMSAGRDF